MSRFSIALAGTLLFGGEVAVCQDFIHLKSGESAACRIEAMTDNITTFSLLTNTGIPGASAKRTIRTDLIDYVEFAFQPGEEAVFKQRAELSSSEAKKWWDLHFRHLHRPRSRAARYGMAFANALLRESPETAAERALRVFDLVIERAWSEDDIATAKQGRLRALMAQGDLETAIHEATILAGDTEDPELLIEVKYLLAEADNQKLQTLVEENPRWEDDDEIRADIESLYHGIIDQYLWPHLFHATQDEAAARGLFAASEVYLSGGENEAALGACQDIIGLYSTTSFAAPAQARIDQLSKSTTTDTEPETL